MCPSIGHTCPGRAVLRQLYWVSYCAHTVGGTLPSELTRTAHVAGVYLLAGFQTLITIWEQSQHGTFMAWTLSTIPCTKKPLHKWGPRLDPVTRVCLTAFQVFVFKTPLGGRKVPSLPCEKHGKICIKGSKASGMTRSTWILPQNHRT